MRRSGDEDAAGFDLAPLPGFDADAPPASARAGALERIPSIPNDARFFDENDLMQLDGVLDFEVTDPDGVAPGLGASPARGGGGAPAGWSDAPSGSADGVSNADWDSSAEKRTPPRDARFSPGRGDEKDSKDSKDFLDPSDPKYKRRIQNRMASARFRAKAKERTHELDKLKSQVAQLRREKRDLEASMRAQRLAAEDAMERHRTSTMAWVVDHFWLRRKVHFKTLANSVRWMVSGKYTPGLTEAVLRAKEERERAARGGGDGRSGDFGSGGAGGETASGRNRDGGAGEPSASVLEPSDVNASLDEMDGDGGEGDPSVSVGDDAGGGRPSFARRVVMFGRRAFDSFRFQRSGAKGPVPSEYALERPHTR